MKSWGLVIVLLLSLGVNLGFLAQRVLRSGGGENPPQVSQAEDERQMRGLPPIFRRLANELRLQGEDRERFFAMQRDFMERTFKGRREVSRLQTELRRELVSRNPDRELIDQRLESLARAHFQLEKVFVDHLLDTREMLGPRQERLFMRFMQRLREARNEGREWQRQRPWRSRPRPPGEEQRPAPEAQPEP